MSSRYSASAFWILFATGTISLVWSFLLAQTPSASHAFDLIQFACSTALLLAAALIAFRAKDPTQPRTWPVTIALCAIAFELPLSVIGVWSSATHLHSL
jgi:dipeptide/tripeptide permease